MGVLYRDKIQETWKWHFYFNSLNYRTVLEVEINQFFGLSIVLSFDFLLFKIAYSRDLESRRIFGSNNRPRLLNPQSFNHA